MKIDANEINKINEALESIEGWSVKDFKIWERKNGEGMATIRLVNKKEKKTHKTEIRTNGTNGMGINITG